MTALLIIALLAFIVWLAWQLSMASDTIDAIKVQRDHAMSQYEYWKDLYHKADTSYKLEQLIVDKLNNALDKALKDLDKANEKYRREFP